MKKNILLKVISEQNIEDEKDTTEVYTDGTIQKKNGCFYIIYKDTRYYENGESIKTILKIKEDKITIIRNEVLQTYIEIEEDKRNIGSYTSTYGNFLVGIMGKKIEIRYEDEDEQNILSIVFEYDLDIDYKHLSFHRIELKIEK
ncbi:MAG: DUF1934 domain-containing protein [Oscillospiraceae bacterium]|nr:DUF1934 domain-containing protein [Oscillospiraceae bacterium]